MDKKTSTEIVHSKKKNSKLQGIVSSYLYQIGIPEDAARRTFGYMYKKLSKDENMIPIAIYRGTLPSMKAGPQGNKMPYVVTNPHQDIELFSCDKLFVLSQLPVQSEGGKSIQESLKDIKAYEDTRRNEQIMKLQEGVKAGFQGICDTSTNTQSVLQSLEEKNLGILNEFHRKVKDTTERVSNAVEQLQRQIPTNVPAMSGKVRMNSHVSIHGPEADIMYDDTTANKTYTGKMKVPGSPNKGKIPGLMRSLGGGNNFSPTHTRLGSR